jgi:hypothetical protein
MSDPYALLCRQRILSVRALFAHSGVSEQLRPRRGPREPPRDPKLFAEMPSGEQRANRTTHPRSPVPRGPPPRSGASVRLFACSAGRSGSRGRGFSRARTEQTNRPPHHHGPTTGRPRAATPTTPTPAIQECTPARYGSLCRYMEAFADSYGKPCLVDRPETPAARGNEGWHGTCYSIRPPHHDPIQAPTTEADRTRAGPIDQRA